MVRSEQRLIEHRVAGRLVQIQPVKLNWFQADAYCKQKNMRMFAPRNDAESTEMFAIVKKFVQARTWVGVHTVLQGRVFKYMETGRQMADSMWAPKEPNNLHGVEDCVEMFNYHVPPRVLNDLDCKEPRAVVCEKP